MPLWLAYTLCSIIFFIVGVITIWAIREGGSFAFLRPSYWREQPRRQGADDRTGPPR